MKRFFIYFIIIFSAPLASLVAQVAPQNVLDSANYYYSAGEYQKAIEKYNALIDLGYRDAGLFYNLGNAYYKVNNMAYAIVNYERAARLDPVDEAIAYNLQMAQSHIVDKMEPLPDFFIFRWVKYLRGSLSADSWAILSLGVFVLSLLLFLGYLFATQMGLRKMAFWSALVLIFFTGVSLAFSLQNKKEQLTRDKAIIYAPSVTVKSAPDRSGTDLFMIHEGTKVELVDSVGPWFEVKLVDGNQGWIQKKDFIRI